MPTTPRYGFPYPAPTDTLRQHPGDHQALADAVEATLAAQLSAYAGKYLSRPGTLQPAYGTTWAAVESVTFQNLPAGMWLARADFTCTLMGAGWVEFALNPGSYLAQRVTTMYLSTPHNAATDLSPTTVFRQLAAGNVTLELRAMADAAGRDADLATRLYTLTRLEG